MIYAVDLIECFKKSLAENWGYIWGTAGIKWTDARQKAKVAYMVKTYGEDWKNKKAAKDNNSYNAALYGAKWVGHTVADCSGLFSYWFAVLGGYMYHGSNTMYNKYCTSKGALSKGKRTDGKELKPGTAVFTYNEEKKNRGHVGLFIGGGYVIEASGTKAGVIKSKITDSKWKYWGELKNVSFDGIVETDEKPTLKKGDKGTYVTLAQSYLIKLGYSCGTTGADGDFGKNTEAAVKAFQKDNGLNADGVIGQVTWSVLCGAKPAAMYAVTVKGLTESQADALIKQYPNSTKTQERGA